MLIKLSCNNYKCLSILLIISLYICPSFCSKNNNDYLIKNVAYGKNNNDVVRDL